MNNNDQLNMEVEVLFDENIDFNPSLSSCCCCCTASTSETAEGK